MLRCAVQVRKAHTNLELERSELEDQQKRVSHKEARITGAASGAAFAAGGPEGLDGSPLRVPRSLSCSTP